MRRSSPPAGDDVRAGRPFSYADVYKQVRRIPAGQVATYGQIARLAGFPRHARQVGYALAALKGREHDVPWQRVINARGEISPRPGSDAAEHQRLLLESEGVCFDEQGRLSLARYQWPPREED